MRASRAMLVITAAAAVGLAGCQETPAPDVEAMAEQVESCELGSIARVHVYEGVYLAGQPTPADLEQAKNDGFMTVINLRHPGEIEDFDERKVVADLGMAYHNPAFKGAEELTDEVFEEVRTLLMECDRPILLHCGSANRVGAVWMAHRAIDDGLAVEDAVREAKTVGLRSADYEEKTRQYIERALST